MTDDAPEHLDPERATERRPTLVSSLVAKLEALSLAHEEGELLGAEDALLLRFGVSRPTLRQAAKVAEAESLISVRRGLRGGFYAARPDAAHAIRAPARYLRLHDATLKQMHAVSRLLAPDIAARAAACTDATLIAEMDALQADLGARDGGKDSVRNMIDSEGILGSLLAQMAGNPVMVLLNQIFFAFGDLERDLKFYRSRDDRMEARRLQLAMCDAVLANDMDAARTISAQRIALVASWIG